MSESAGETPKTPGNPATTGENPAGDNSAGDNTAGDNAVDRAIRAGKAGTISSQQVVEAIWNSELVSVGRMTDENDPATFQALSLTSPGGGEKVVATFSDPAHIPDEVRKVAPFAIRNTGQVTIGSIHSGYGLAVNPGGDPGLELSAESVAQIIEAFRRAREQRSAEDQA